MRTKKWDMQTIRKFCHLLCCSLCLLELAGQLFVELSLCLQLYESRHSLRLHLLVLALCLVQFAFKTLDVLLQSPNLHYARKNTRKTILTWDSDAHEYTRPSQKQATNIARYIWQKHTEKRYDETTQGQQLEKRSWCHFQEVMCAFERLCALSSDWLFDERRKWGEHHWLWLNS